MNKHNITPDHKSKKWLLYCLNQGYSQRKTAELAGVSAPSIRLWLKKHGIKWRGISSSLLLQSDEVSRRAKKVWSNPDKCKKQSETMKRVQATRKRELSISAKKNWKNNRDIIITGIQKAANTPTRKEKLSELAKQLWQDNEYRSLLSGIIAELWRDKEYKHKTTAAIREKCTTKEFSQQIKERYKNKEYKQKIVDILINRRNDPKYSKKQSDMAKRLWEMEHYREKQQQQRKQKNKHISTKMKKQWRDGKYRAKYATGIDIEKFLATCIERHNDHFNYDSTRFGSWKNKITIICNICKHKSTLYPQSHIESGYCSGCGTSTGQREIYTFLSKLVSCDLNNKSAIKPLELDIFTPKHKLAIEYHGLYWHSYNYNESKRERNRHQEKMKRCDENGILLMQYFDFEWFHKTKLIKSMIRCKLGMATKINARNLNVAMINDTQAQQFFNANHLNGHRTAKYNIALTSTNQIISVMSFSKHKNGYEIIRMATQQDHIVRGGASRLLSYFIKMRRPLTIYTFADLRYSNGNVYQKLDFEEIGTTKPGYFYYKGNTILSRQKCQKHRLHRLLDDFDPQLTEAKNMFNHGFRRVWDAGHKKFRLKV